MTEDVAKPPPVGQSGRWVLLKEPKGPGNRKARRTRAAKKRQAARRTDRRDARMLAKHGPKAIAAWVTAGVYEFMASRTLKNWGGIRR